MWHGNKGTKAQWNPKNLTRPNSTRSHTRLGACTPGMGEGVLFYIVFMGKDPAFLFYPGDWMGGTVTLTRAHKGAYMDALMAQFNSGHLSESDIEEVLGKDYKNLWDSKLKSKFSVDKNGLYYNERLDLEVSKRRSYTASRLKNLGSHMDSHMGGHMENENEDINKNGKINESAFNEIWGCYPKKDGKKQALRHFKASVKTESDLKRIRLALDHYLNSQRVVQGYIKNGSTWFNNWEDWVEYEEKVCPECKGKGKFMSKTGYEVICACPIGVAKG